VSIRINQQHFVISYSFSCRSASPDQVKVVKVVAKEIAKLSAQLVDCATEMSKTFQVEEEDEPPLPVREEAELLRREWSSQASSK